MKRTDEEIDKMFQDAAGKFEVPYQDSYWDEMEALLPKKSKKKAFWWIFGVLFALINIATTLVVLFPRKAQIAKQNEIHVNSKSDQLKQLTKENNNSANNTNINVDGKSIDLKDNAVNQTAETSNSSNNLGAKQQQNTGSLIESNNKNIKASNSNSNRDVRNNKVILSKTKDVRPKDNGKQNLAIESRGIESRNVNDAMPNEKSAIAERKENSSIESTEIPTLNPIQNPNLEQGNQLAQQAEKVEQIEKDSLTQSKEAAEKPILASQNEAQESNPEIKSDLTNPVRKANTGSYYVQLGGNFGQSYIKAPSKNLMAGITLGLGYQLVKPGIGYSVGLNATSNFVKNMEIVRKSRVYGFGVTNYQQNLNYKQLTYLEIPLNINYTHLRNTFSVGVTPTYLVSTMLSFSERQESEVINERNFYGQKLGLKSVGLDAMIGYQRVIKSNWSVGVNLGVSLVQQIEPNNFEYQAVAFPLKGQVILRRTLTFKK